MTPADHSPPPHKNTSELTEAFRVLAEADKVEVPRMGEQMFVEHILPILAADPGQRTDMTKWMDVAGTPLRAIDVVNEATGEVIFRVPPLMRSIPTIFQQEVNYSNIIIEAQAHGQNHSSQEDLYLRRELAKAKIAGPLLDFDTAAQWNLIRKRYDLPLLPIPGAEKVSAASLTAPNSGGDLQVNDDQDDF